MGQSLHSSQTRHSASSPEEEWGQAAGKFVPQRYTQVAGSCCPGHNTPAGLLPAITPCPLPESCKVTVLWPDLSEAFSRIREDKHRRSQEAISLK